jgi:indole-3-glycerol phosphate synthase/phosphoribosylanthranilate isomerase
MAELGPAEGLSLPLRREAPLIPFPDRAGLICEIKRRSPSRGAIAPNLDPVTLVRHYVEAGAGSISVLTEQESFGGSLSDLIQVKKAFPQLAVLRKDFLLTPEDVTVSWQAGADAVLLIAGILDSDRLEELYRKTRELGLQALVEIHDQADLDKAERFQPDLVGINSRDLRNFHVDPLLPLVVRQRLSWHPRTVYESGITHPEEGAFAASAGFDALLVGEGVVRRPTLVGELLASIRDQQSSRFWNWIAKRLGEKPGRPLVKICGLTSEADAQLAEELGADLLGFVFWPQSKRRADPALLRCLTKLRTPKVGVVVLPPNSPELPEELAELLAEGQLDAIQFHGGETGEDCFRLQPVYYKAIRPTTREDLASAKSYHSPRILLDGAATLPGGSGEKLGQLILSAWKQPLWLAGGLTPDNIQDIVTRHHPELIDLASGIEASPGVKDHDKMRRLFTNLAEMASQYTPPYGVANP